MGQFGNLREAGCTIRGYVSVPLLGSTRLESYKWLGDSNVCDKCKSAGVQDEMHALVYCNCFEMCELRKKYKDVFIDLSSLYTIMASNYRLYSFLGKLSHYN
eukprot:1142705-Pelagomonas_calceolata.AAC.2